MYEYGQSRISLRPDTPPDPVAAMADLYEQVQQLQQQRDGLDQRITELLDRAARFEQNTTESEKRAARRAARKAAAQQAGAEARARVNAARMAEVDQHRAEQEAAHREEGRLLTAAVCFITGITEDELHMAGRSTADISTARIIGYRVARDLGWSLPRIGEWSGRHHTSVMYGLRRYDERFPALDPLRHRAHAHFTALTRPIPTAA